MRTGFLLVVLGVVTASILPPQERALTKTLPAGWSYVGCKVDVGNRILVAASQVSAANTPQTCIAFCSREGYTMAGVEFSECPPKSAGAEARTTPSQVPCSPQPIQIALPLALETRHRRVAAQAASKSIKTRPRLRQGAAAWLGHPSNNNFDPAIFVSPKVGFLYNWGHANTPKNTEFPFYATQWNAAGIDTLEADARAAGATTILAFNEPDISTQANMTPESAASYYLQYIHPLSAKGFKLATPAVTNGGAPAGLTWLDAFLAACTGCKYDYIALHWYGGWIDDFTDFINAAKKYNKPIYLTEFGLSWDADAQASNYEEFLPLALIYLDGEPAVAKYAFFGAFHSGTGKDMIAANGTLTTLGQMYVT
ncbi:glycosyl hydrolase catalytic core-domain-containing protein [Mycena alexandri]|uniref:Glycosyl hydrolase catalytic core-domain-containing protein n=1 Tax=Mycena alexandri TaxID=1745969 RepID=A0AAD6SRX4_9AGAR|nr:glycosyl hydrolase catalytic core-domain-containing protein [Mycena alexandri]